jgi:tRNA dimethylallyltransferase
MIDSVLVVGLKPEREELKRHVAERVDNMLEAGLEAEVRGLVQRYGWSCEALRAIGYAEWQDYFEGHQSLAETRQKIIKNTADLAKRQRTWFKRNNSIHWLTTPVDLTNAVDLVTTFLES